MVSHYALNKIDALYRQLARMVISESKDLKEIDHALERSRCCADPTGLPCIHVVYYHFLVIPSPIPIEAVDEQWHIAKKASKGSGLDILPLELLNPITRGHRNKGRPPGARNKPKSSTQPESSTKREPSQFKHVADELECDIQGAPRPQKGKQKLGQAEAYKKTQSNWVPLPTSKL